MRRRLAVLLVSGISLTTIWNATPAGALVACGRAFTQATTVDQSITEDRFFGIDALGPKNVWAVGRTAQTRNETLTEHWNGQNWSVITSPNKGTHDNELEAVDAVSKSDVWAVGDYVNDSGVQRNLIMHWNGTSWKVITSPSVTLKDQGLSGVAAVSPDDVWAAGWYEKGTAGKSLLEHWNGSKWVVVPSPSPGSVYNYLAGVSVASSDDAWAVGNWSGGGADQTLILHWNGDSWKKTTSRNPSTTVNSLDAVAAIGGDDAWAVGSFQDSTPTYKTLTEHWNGSAWKVVSSPEAAGSTDNFLDGVSAVASRDVWGVGVDLQANYVPLIEHWTGTAWKIVTSPSPGGTYTALSAVTTTSDGHVWGAGVETSTGPFQTFVVQRCP